MKRRVSKMVFSVLVSALAGSMFVACGSTSEGAADESATTSEAAPSDADVEDDAGVDALEKATVTDARVRTVVHVLRRFSLTTSSGLVMNNDHVTASNLSTALANANSLWKQPALQSVVMNASVVEESPLNLSSMQTLKKTILATTRDDSSASFDAYWKLLDPSKRTDSKALHIYIVPFYGQTLQGVTRLSSSADRRGIIIGSWSNKDGGGTPEKRSITAPPTCASFPRTLAHEFGHALTLQHSDCTDCIMKGCTDVSPVRSKALRGWAQYWQ